MDQGKLQALLDDKAKRVLARTGLPLATVIHADGFAYVVVSGEAHVVEQRLDLTPFLSLTGGTAGAAIERAVMDMRPEFARTFPALRKG